ncbi:MAG: hypothetical protein MRY21_04445 [Simkaniaceae bacterium]|nr:hypothetical protein [Simkaniaceae bacterium]
MTVGTAPGILVAHMRKTVTNPCEFVAEVVSEAVKGACAGIIAGVTAGAVAAQAGARMPQVAYAHGEDNGSAVVILTTIAGGVTGAVVGGFTRAVQVLSK